MPGFALLLVEAGLWTRYVLDAEGVSITAHASGPQPADALVFTGEAVIEAITGGRLSVDEAFQLGRLTNRAAFGTALATQQAA